MAQKAVTELNELLDEINPIIFAWEVKHRKHLSSLNLERVFTLLGGIRNNISCIISPAENMTVSVADSVDKIGDNGIVWHEAKEDTYMSYGTYLLRFDDGAITAADWKDVDGKGEFCQIPINKKIAKWSKIK